MKRLILVAVLFCSLFHAQAQRNPFPSIDSLVKFTNIWVRNSAIDAFTALRLNTVLQGLARFTDSSLTFSTRGVDTVYRSPGKDSIIYKINGLRYAIKDSTGGAGGGVDSIYRTPGKDSIIFSIAGRRHAIKDSTGGAGGYDSTVMASVKRLKDSIAAVRAAIAAGDSVGIDHKGGVRLISAHDSTLVDYGFKTTSDLLEVVRDLSDSVVNVRPKNDSIPTISTVIGRNTANRPGEYTIPQILGYTPENVSNKNSNNGYAGLNGSGKVAYPQLDTNHTTGLVAWPGLLAQGYGTGGSSGTPFPAETPLGNIYVKSSWNAADLYELTAQGDNTIALNGTNLRITGSSGAFNGYIRVPIYGGAHGLQTWDVSVSFRIITHSYGMQMGTHCFNPGRANDIIGFINMNSSPANITIYKSAGASGTRLDSGTPPTMGFIDGDSSVGTLHYSLYDSTITFTVKNTSTNTTSTPIVYPLTAGDVANTGWFQFGSVGGTYDVYNVTISSQETKNALVACVSDSKKSGAIAGSFGRGASQQLGTIFNHTIIYGGQGDLLENTVTASLGCLRALNPYQIELGSMGRNDLATGTTPAQLLGFSDILYNSFVPFGTAVYFGNFSEGSTSGQAQHIKTFDSLVHVKYPAYYIPLFAATVQSNGISAIGSLLNGDSIHPNGPGHDLWFITDTASHKLVKLTARSAQIQGGDNYTGLVGTHVVPLRDKEFKTVQVVNDTTLMIIYKDGSFDIQYLKGKSGSGTPTLDQLLAHTGSNPLTATYTVNTDGFGINFDLGSSSAMGVRWIVPLGDNVGHIGYTTQFYIDCHAYNFFSKTGYYAGDAVNNGGADPAGLFVAQKYNADSDTSHAFKVQSCFGCTPANTYLGGIRANSWVTVPKVIISPNGSAVTTGGAGLQVNDSIRATVLPNGNASVDSAVVWNSTYKTLHKVAPAVADYDEGVYSPGISNTTNVSVSSLGFTNWARVKNGYTISGLITITPTIIATITTFDIDMPNGTWGVSDASKIAGTGQGDGVALGATIKGNTSTGKAKFEFVSTGTSAVTIYFIFHGHYEAP